MMQERLILFETRNYTGPLSDKTLEGGDKNVKYVLSFITEIIPK